MRIYLSQPCYKWLVQLKILKAYIVAQQSLSHVVVQQQQPSSRNQNLKRYQLCYDDQIYLQNGYLVGVLMREILKAHQLSSDKLIKIRKIAVLKKDENWAIVKDVLTFLDYPFDEEQQDDQQTGSYQPDLKQIQRILQFLYNDYGPFASNRKDRTHRYFHLEPSIIHPQYEKNRLQTHLDGVSPYSYPNCNNLLEYTCFAIHKSFNFRLRIDECMGLLVDKGKYLKKLIINGLPQTHSQPDTQTTSYRFEVVQTLYQQLLNSTTRFDQLLSYQPQHLEHFMDIFATGVLSKSLDVAKMASLLIESIEDQKWFKNHGVRIMVRSEWPEVMNLIIDKARGCFREVFSEDLQGMFVYQQDYLTFLIRFLPILAKSMYSKQVFQHFTLPYLLQKTTAPFDPDDITSSQPKIRHLARQVITIIFKHFYKKIPQTQRTRACIAFDVNPYYGLKMALWETFALLANLFDVIKVFLVNEDATVEKYFKIVVRYLRAKEADVKEMVVENLKELYFTMRKSFPLGAFLTAYEDIVALQPISNKPITKPLTPTSPIAQHFDFDLLLAISKDQSLVQEEVIKALNIALQYFLQINGDSFLEVILNLLKFKESAEWCRSISQQILQKWTEIKLPPLISNVYNRKSPQEMCRFEAFGVKRREILKFQEYQKYKLVLEAVCQLKDSSFLREYAQRVNKKVQEINRNKDLAAYNIFLKKLLQKIRLNRTLLPQPIELASKSLIYRSQGMPRNDTIQHGLEELNEEEDVTKSQFMGQNDDGLRKLRDEVTESPIQHNRKENGSIKSRKQNGIGGENDVEMEDELNEFLQTRGKGKIRQNAQGDNNLVDQSSETNTKETEKYLKPFTQQQFRQNSEPNDIFIHPQQLQQFELTYIKIHKQNNQTLINTCAKAYLKCFSEAQKYQIECLTKFLTSLKLNKHLPQKEAVILWRKACEIHVGTIDKSHQLQLTQQKARQIVWQLLVQYSFLMFGFKRNTRTRVKLIQIFLKLLTGNLTQNGLLTLETIPESKPQTIMKRQMTFENQLISNKLLKWNPQYENQYLKGQVVVAKNPLKNKSSESQEQIASRILESHQNTLNTNDKNQPEKLNEMKPKYQMRQFHHNSLQSWLVCFEILNDIIALPPKQKSLGLGLIEPISKITTSVLPQLKAQCINQEINKKQQNNDNQEQSEEQMNEQQIELKFLQEQLQKLQASQAKSKSPTLKKSRKITTNQQSQKTQAKKPPTKPPKLEYSTKAQQRLPNVSFSKITASQLQQKIKNRKNQLKQEIRKKTIVPELNEVYEKGQNVKAQQPVESQKQKDQPQKISYNVDA